MPNPSLAITPALELLSSNMKILPATGGAVEDLQHPDRDKIDDVLVHRDMDNEVTAFAEEPEPSTSDIYINRCLLYHAQSDISFGFLSMAAFVHIS